MLELELNDFPDEIILRILINVDIKGLFQCAQICKRINMICQDNSLYEKVRAHISINLYIVALA